jgi:hypothetical protein
MDIEQRLRESLAAREPPASFEDAVLARVQAARPLAAAVRRRPAWRWPAALAATVLAAAIGLHWYDSQQRAEQSYEQLVLALAITSNQLSEVQQRLVRPEPQSTQENGT